MGATCLSEELDRLKKKKKSAWVSSESSRFAYRVVTGPFSYFKLAALEYSRMISGWGEGRVCRICADESARSSHVTVPNVA